MMKLKLQNFGNLMKRTDSGDGNGNLLQYSCLGNPMDRGAWQAILHGVSRVRYDLMTKTPKTLYSHLSPIIIYFLCKFVSDFLSLCIMSLMFIHVAMLIRISFFIAFLKSIH